MERPETVDAKVFVNNAAELSFNDKSDAVATFEAVGKAMEGKNVKERQLISLLDVTDVIDRATRFLDEKGTQSEYYNPGAHFTASNSMWQCLEKGED